MESQARAAILRSTGLNTIQTLPYVNLLSLTKHPRHWKPARGFATAAAAIGVTAVKMHFILNKITHDFAEVLRRRLQGDGDAGEIWTVVDYYICAGMNIPEDPTFGYPTNHMEDLALERLTPAIVNGLFKIAALLDEVAQLNIDSDDNVEIHLRARMQADAEMTAAKAFLKSFYQNKNGDLHYPTRGELTVRGTDTFRLFLNAGRRQGGAGSIYASTLSLMV